MSPFKHTRGEGMAINIDGKEWKLVPVEPNAAMVEAGISAIKQAPDVGGICAEYTAEAYDAYTAMLAAAPPAPVVEVTDEVAEFIGGVTDEPQIVRVVRELRANEHTLRARIAELEKLVEAAFREGAGDNIFTDGD